MINDTILLKRHSLFLAVFGFVYLLINYLTVTSKGGKPLYWFLDWKDHWSIIYGAALCGTFTLFFCVLAALDQSITGRSSRKGNLRVSKEKKK